MEKNEVEAIYKKHYLPILEEELTKFLSDRNISRKYVSESLIDTIFNALIVNDTEEFIKEISLEKLAVIDDVDDYIKEFIAINYDDSYFVVKFERGLDLDGIQHNLEEELVLILINTEPYGYVSRSYWYEKVKSVRSITLLGKFIDNHLEEFLLEYAEDWCLQTKEI